MRSSSDAPGCRKKVCYTSKKQARGALRTLRQAKDVEEPETLSVYKCRECRYFHIGHRRRRADVVVDEPSAIKTVIASRYEAVLIVWKRKDGTDVREMVRAPLSAK